MQKRRVAKVCRLTSRYLNIGNEASLGRSAGLYSEGRNVKETNIWLPSDHSCDTGSNRPYN